MTVWVNIHVGKCVVSCGAGVDVLESTNFLSSCILMNFQKLPSKIDIDSSLMALLKSNFVGVGELVNPLVGREVGDSSRSAAKSLNLILSQE